MAIKFCRNLHPEFSNFEECGVTVFGKKFGSVEAAFQSQKSTDDSEIEKFTTMTAREAKKAGRTVKLRPDWEDVKLDIMHEACLAKFSQHEYLKEALLSTEDEEIIENTTAWHDNIWGNCECPRCINKVGQNLLGKTLMKVRDELRNS